MKNVEPNTFIKPSKIHGLGLFAARNIKKGEEIVQGKANYNHYLQDWIRYLKECKVKSMCFQKGYCMVNHSETPNTYRKNDSRIIAAKAILFGEEITEDYYQLSKDDNPFTSVGAMIEEMIFQSK